MRPEVTQLPPRSPVEPTLKDVRQFYVKPYDLDPASNGIGFTDGCPGCRHIMLGARKAAHDDQCRHRVIKSAATNADVAARLKKAIDRDEEYHAKRLEATRGKRGPEEETLPEERPAKDQRKEEVMPEGGWGKGYRGIG